MKGPARFFWAIFVKLQSDKAVKEEYTDTMDGGELRSQAAAAAHNHVLPSEVPTPVPVTGERKGTGPLILANANRFIADPETNAYLCNLFKTEFNDFETFMQGKKQATDLFEATMDDLMRRTVAEEFQRTLDYSYVAPSGETVVAPTAQPVLMFRRAAFVHNVMEKAGYNQEQKTFAENPSFIFLDLKDLFSANMSGAGDWLLSTAARTINDAAREYCMEIGKSGSYATCRYGGDEFMVGTSGLSSDEVRGLQQVIRNRLAGKTGYYLNAESGRVEERPIALNEEKNAVITVPEDPVERNIFLAYLNRGLILDGEQVGKVRGLFTKDGAFDEEGFESSVTHTKGESDLDRKIAGILLGSPDLSLAMTLADYIDRKEIAVQPAGKERAQLGRRKENLVNLLEGVVYDGLLGENVLSFEGMQSELRRGNVQKMLCLDLKFVKEINDMSSYVEGDEQIQKLWEMVEARLDRADKRNYIFARRGGTLLIALRKGVNGAKDRGMLETTRQFVDGASVRVRKETAAVPLGSSMVHVPHDGTMSYEESGKVIGASLMAAEADWYGKMTEIIRSDVNLTGAFDEYHNRLQAGEDPAELADHFHALIAGTPPARLDQRLLLNYFFGKAGLRRELRLNRIMEELHPKNDNVQQDAVHVQ